MRFSALVQAGALVGVLALGAALPAAVPASAQTTAARIDAQRLIGQPVKNPAGDTIGSIESVILDRDGKAVAAVVGVGGFLGLGQRDVALDWKSLTVLDDGRSVRAPFTKEQLKALPEYRYPDASQRRTAYYDRDYRAAPAAQASNGWAPFGPGGEMRASKLIGADVVNAAGDKLGQVGEILISPKHELAVVVSFGGFLGMGDRNIAIDWRKIKIERRTEGDGLRLLLNMSKDQILALPDYRYDNPHSMILR